MQKTFALAFALLLAGCGQKQTAHVQKHADNTQIVPAFPEAPQAERVGHQADEPPPTEGMRGFRAGSTPETPSWLPLYPGAHVLGGFGRGGRVRGGKLIFETEAQPADVIAFYEKTATGAGFVQTMNSASGDTITFAAAAGRRRIQVTAGPIANGSQVQIFWAGGE
jgi:hypothetical protein